MVIETERLILREMVQSDFPLLCKCLQDPDVMLLAFGHVFSDKEVQDNLDKQIWRYENHGFGVWSVILKETGELIGQCGLSMQPYNDREVPEIGYVFQKEHWHKGYAIEAAAACKEYAFTVQNIDEVFSIIRDTNIASQNVAKRNGMTIKDKTDIHIVHANGVEMKHNLWSAKRDE